MSGGPRKRRVDHCLGGRSVAGRESIDEVVLAAHEDATEVRELAEALDAVVVPGAALADAA
jgi:hypothetical protein